MGAHRRRNSAERALHFTSLLDLEFWFALLPDQEHAVPGYSVDFLVWADGGAEERNSGWRRNIGLAIGAEQEK